MLTVIRKYTGNIFFKIIFGLIVLSFAVFFGTVNMTDQGASNRFGESPAMVNNTAINAQRFSNILNDQMSAVQENNQTQEKIPPEYTQFIKQKILNMLVSRELIRQFLIDNGLEISKQELAENISGMENFNHDGKFDFDYYNNEYLKGYQLKNGSSFEEDIKNDISTKHFFGYFDRVLKPTSDEINKLHTFNQTLYQFSFVRVAKKEKLDEAAQDKKTPTQDVNLARQKATSIHVALKNGGDAKNELDQYKLELKDTKEINATQIVKVMFGGVASPDNLKKLTNLSLGKPMPDDIIDEGNYYYVVRLMAFKQPPEKMADETRAQLTQDYTQDWSGLLEMAFLKDLRDKAKIKINKNAFAQ